jgi:hypothetical protein
MSTTRTCDVLEAMNRRCGWRILETKCIARQTVIAGGIFCEYQGVTVLSDALSIAFGEDDLGSLSTWKAYHSTLSKIPPRLLRTKNLFAIHGFDPRGERRLLQPERSLSTPYLRKHTGDLHNLAPCDRLYTVLASWLGICFGRRQGTYPGSAFLCYVVHWRDRFVLVATCKFSGRHT